MPRRIGHLKNPMNGFFATSEVHHLELLTAFNKGFSTSLSKTLVQEFQSVDGIDTDQTLLLLGPSREAVKNALSAVNRPSAGVNLPYFYRPKSKTTNMIIITERTIWQRHTQRLCEHACCVATDQRLPPQRHGA